MASQNPTQRNSLYPEVIHFDPPYQNPNVSTSSSSKLYPSLDMADLVNDLFPEPSSAAEPSAPLVATEEVVLRIPGAILHLIDRHNSVELASGDFSVTKLWQGGNAVAVLARVGDEIQWPLAKDGAAVKLDDSHYFFSLRTTAELRSEDGDDDDGGDELLNYGLTITSRGQERLVRELDSVLGSCSCFTVQRVSPAVDRAVAAETFPAELEGKREVVEGRSAAYWTTLAPNVEDYSGTAAKMIAAGSGHVVRGILWCGDVTVERLKWGNEVMKRRMSPGSEKEVSPQTLRRIKRVKRVSKTTEKVANGVLSGVVKVSGFFISSVANSKAGKKFFSLLPGEIVLASLDGFSKVCDAVEVSGKNVMSTSSTVTTELVTHRYGEQAGKATNEGLDAAGHAVGAAWAAFKIRKAFNPKSVLKPIAKNAAKAAALDQKDKKKSK